MASLLGYIGMYAQVTMYGYRKAELARELRKVDMQNQALKAEIQMLTSPDRLAAVAESAGMVQSSKIVYIASPGSTVNVAKAE
jgi:cell division protein FtsL